MFNNIIESELDYVLDEFKRAAPKVDRSPVRVINVTPVYSHIRKDEGEYTYYGARLDILMELMEDGFKYRPSFLSGVGKLEFELNYYVSNFLGILVCKAFNVTAYTPCHFATSTSSRIYPLYLLHLEKYV